MSAKSTPGPWQFCRETTVDRGDGYGIKAPAPHHWVIPPLNINPADAKLMASAQDLLAALKESRRAIGDHYAPNDCYATGPMTGDPFRDLVQCPACSAISMYDEVIAKIEGSK